MTVEEARRTLAERAGERVCVRYSCDAEDNIVFAGRRPSPLRATVMATALAACAASEVAPVEETPGPPELCGEDELPVADGEPESCEGESPVDPVDPRRELVEIGVSVSTTMGVPAAIGVGLPPLSLPLPARVVVHGGAEPGPPRHVLPLDTWMGAVPPDVLTGALPPGRDDDR